MANFMGSNDGSLTVVGLDENEMYDLHRLFTDVNDVVIAKLYPALVDLQVKIAPPT